MIDLLKKELDSKSALSGPLPDIAELLVEAIPEPTIPHKMKLTIAMSELILYASQFRRNIHHWDGGEVPINSISLVISGSGKGKDSSVNAARKCFNVGYELINAKRKTLAKQKAIQLARDAGEDNPTEWEVYKPYYNAPNPLFVAPSTTEGLIQHFNDIDSDGIGAGFQYSGEIGSELATNPIMTDNIRLQSEMYDLGNKEVKVLKARENQSREIKGLPVSALFVGSPDNLLYDEGIKRKVEVELSTKLARRSFLCFAPFGLPEKNYESVDLMLEAEMKRENEALRNRELISAGVTTLTNYHLPKAGQLMEVEASVRRLFLTYKRYNTELAENTNPMHKMSALVRRHLQWKALKLAGALAIFDMSDIITENHYIQAIRYCELLDKDMQEFEAELVKEPYELFSDYMSTNAVNGKASIGLHALRKMKYIPMNGNPLQKMKDLVHLAAAYDHEAIYSVVGDEIHYEKIVKTDVLSISYIPIDNSEIFAVIENGGDKAALTKAKERVSYVVANGLETGSTTFEDLGSMLTQDFAYSPFVFKDGIRSKDGIIGGTKWLVLDIDDSCVTAEEAHFMLQDINHHIALSSDKDNHFKFRVIIELDSVVDVNAIVWRHFYTAIAEHLSLKVDVLAQSAIFYSYSGRPVLSTLDAEPLPVRDFIMQANDRAENTTPIAEKRIPNTQKEAMLADPLTTFSYAFEAPMGAGSRNLIRAAYHARDLGLDKEGIIDLINQINQYWTYPIDDERLEKTIISQIMRW